MNLDLDKIKAFASARAECTVDAGAKFVKIEPADSVKSNWEVVGQGSGVFSNGKPMRMAEAVKITGNNSRVYVMHGAQVYGHIEIKGDNSTVYIGARTRLRGLRVVITGDNASVTFGQEATTEHAVFFAFHSGANIVVGDDCMFSSGVVLRTNDHHAIFDRNTKELLSTPDDIVVGAHAWIGNGARITKGVTIGRGGVIGQMSVVTKDTEPHCVYAGVPAKKVRENIAWSRNAEWGSIPEQFR